MPDARPLTDLPRDIYALFNEKEDHVPSEANLEAFSENVKALLKTRLAARSQEARVLRFSALGKPDRQIWYDAHPDGSKEVLSGPTYLKFMYGDLIEQLILFLAKEAGHEISCEQGKVSVDGVTGSIDAVADGVVVDVKSASPYGYKKFAEGRVTEDDPFGYVGQLSGYSDVLTPGKDAAWIAMDKVSGEVCVSPLKSTVIKHHKPGPRIAHLKKVLENEEAPPRCYEPIPDGAAGNLKLPTPCSYCGHKWRCHADLRAFAYSQAPRFLTKVVRLPDVPEIARSEFLSDTTSTTSLE